MSSITATLAPTDAPSYEGNFSYLRQNMMWMLLWFTTMVVFIILPFCTSKRRREACARGIRERRWISQEEFDAEEFNLIEAREQDSRRQQRENTQRHFQITKTQEDEIRHQYLSYIMEDYTMTLKSSDIQDKEDIGDTSTEDNLEHETTLIGKETEESENDVENQCDATMVSSSIESGDTARVAKIDENKASTDGEVVPEIPVRQKRSNTETSEDLLECEFDNNQTVCVPLAGQSVGKEIDEMEGATSGNALYSNNRRVVSNGCAICLCRFEEDEQITWSSNPDCCHVYHSDCIINWYLAFGRKTQKRRRRNNPNITDEECLDLICDFPILCPCCRQEFCLKGTQLNSGHVEVSGVVNTTSTNS